MADRPIIVRVPAELRASLERSAKASERSLSGEVRRILREAVRKAS